MIRPPAPKRSDWSTTTSIARRWKSPPYSRPGRKRCPFNLYRLGMGCEPLSLLPAKTVHGALLHRAESGFRQRPPVGGRTHSRRPRHLHFRDRPLLRRRSGHSAEFKGRFIFVGKGDLLSRDEYDRARSSICRATRSPSTTAPPCAPSCSRRSWPSCRPGTSTRPWSCVGQMGKPFGASSGEARKPPMA